MSGNNAWRRPIGAALYVGLVLCALPGRSTGQAADILDRSVEVATHVELYRSLPDAIEVGGVSLDAAGFFRRMIHLMLQLDGQEVGGDAGDVWGLPTDLLPRTTLDAAVYGLPAVKEEYLEFLQSVWDAYPANAALSSGLPSALSSELPFRGGYIRFVDAFYMAASILRFHRMFGYLPTTVDPKIASPNGLFPWDVPTDLLEFTGAVQNDEGRDYPRSNQFYEAGVMDHDLYALARQIIQNETDAYEAGRLIRNWVRERYFTTPYGAAADVMDGPIDSYEMIRNMQGTSDTPWRPKAGLFPAAAIPHGYGTFKRGILPYGGAVYFDGAGWVSAEFHRGYGTSIASNEFLTIHGAVPWARDPNAVSPLVMHPVIEAGAEMIANSGSTAELRAFWVNGQDVQECGADRIVQTALSGEFNTVVLTVKSFMGRLYFETDEPGDNIAYDALAELAPAAQDAGLRVLAAVNTLSDYESGQANVWGQHYFQLPYPESTPWNEFYMSPCSDEYVSYLKRLIGALHNGYEIDGLVFARNFVIFDAWNSPDCGVLPSDRARDDRLAEFVNDLAAYAKSVQASGSVYFLTAPLVDTNGNQVDELTDDATAADLQPEFVDGIILGIFGMSWLTDNLAYPLRSAEGLERFITEYTSETTLPVYTTLHVSKEWNIHRSSTEASHGISGLGESRESCCFRATHRRGSWAAHSSSSTTAHWNT